MMALLIDAALAEYRKQEADCGSIRQQQQAKIDILHASYQRSLNIRSGQQDFHPSLR